MIQTVSCSLSDLFNGNVRSQQEDGTVVSFSGRLNVPEYQRPYLWGKRETDRMLTDLDEHFSKVDGPQPDFYLGSIILHQKGDELNIIDGQQRLTTMALLLSVLNSGTVAAIDYSSPSSTQHIRDNYKYLLTKPDTFKRISGRISDNINVTLVVTDREDDAYTFFETQNTGGVRLSGVDIIKAYHLRAIGNKRFRSRAAVKWEKQNDLDAVVSLVLKARYWNSLNPGKFEKTPKRNHRKSVKNAIIEEFSEHTRTMNPHDVGFVVAKVKKSGGGVETTIPGLPYAIRQPLNNGENLIGYMAAFCGLYHEIFPYADGDWKDQSYESFINRVIKPVDGTLFLKELFEIAMLCYAHRFGTEHLYEAALWLFRCTFERRLKNPKTVRETSVPEFLREYPVLDIILNAFDHQQLIGSLKRYKVTVSDENLTGNTVKCRYLQRLTEFFNTNYHLPADAIDECFQNSIKTITD